MEGAFTIGLAERPVQTKGSQLDILSGCNHKPPRPIRIAVAFLFLVATLLFACGGQRREGLEELRRIQTALEEVQTAVSIGVTEEGFSKRLTDALLKAGNLGDSIEGTIGKFPRREREAVEQVYIHWSRAVDAYRASRDYFGRKQVSVDVWKNTLPVEEFNELRERFPTLREAEVYTNLWGHVEGYYRSDVLQGLWVVASEELSAARAQIQALTER